MRISVYGLKSFSGGTESSLLKPVQLRIGQITLGIRELLEGQVTRLLRYREIENISGITQSSPPMLLASLGLRRWEDKKVIVKGEKKQHAHDNFKKQGPGFGAIGP